VTDACDTLDDPAHAWNRFPFVWQIVFWAFLALAALNTWGSSSPPGRRVLAWAVLVVLGLAYAGLRPSAETRPLRRNRVYLAVAVAATGLGCFADPAVSVLLFALFSQMWLFSDGARAGAVLSVALAVAALTGLVASDGWSGDTLLALAPVMVISVLLSILMGVWINRIIGQSMDRAALIRDLESTRAELGEAHHAAGVMAERERVAREIHDTLAQGYTSVIMLAQGALAVPSSAPDRLAMIESVARENLAEARALVAAFAPVGLSDSTLVDAIRRLAERFSAETGVGVTLDLPPSLAGLARDREVVLLRAVQEALTNVRRHAGASAVTVRVGTAPALSVTVQDDGRGFAAQPEGFGLAGMRARVQSVGGSVSVDSTPGAGTRVEVRLP
jgi:signal transduction histidine kinase